MMNAEEQLVYGDPEREQYAPENHMVHSLGSNLVGPHQMLKKYATFANKYDKDFADENYAAPRLVVEALLKMYPKSGPIPLSELKVMDIAAGTGLAGQKIYDAGVRKLDALDASPEMLSILHSRKIYQRAIEDTIGEHEIDVADDTYDVITVAGGFVQGHCPITAFDEMIRICKPGGYVINAMRLEYLFTVPEYDQLENHLKSLEMAGKWRRIERRITDKYFFDAKQGITHVYQKL